GSWKHAAALLDWGFAHAAQVSPVGQLVEPARPTPAASPSTRSPAPPAANAAAAERSTVTEAPPTALVVLGALVVLTTGLLFRVRQVARRRRERARWRPPRPTR
ncbi:MAG TPA: hypothetical protein VLC50_00005, partial [Actinomycetes bacterium]|nr:hypothetical protein [Actinomycetes bacterium]